MTNSKKSDTQQLKIGNVSNYFTSKFSLNLIVSDHPRAKIVSSLNLLDEFLKIWDTDTLTFKESMYILFLNGANKIIGYELHSVGASAQTVVDIRLMMTTALLCNSAAISIAHNHPSGQTHPSQEDTIITKRVKEACTFLGIRFLDHIILCGGTSYFSFADEGKL